MNEAALRARSLTLADGQVVVPIEDVLELAAPTGEDDESEWSEGYAEGWNDGATATPSGGPLREAAEAVVGAWYAGTGPATEAQRTARAKAVARLAAALAATPSGGPLDEERWRQRIEAHLGPQRMSQYQRRDIEMMARGAHIAARLTEDAG